MDELFLVLTNKDFGYVPSYPTLSTLADKSLNNTRTKFVKEAV